MSGIRKFIVLLVLLFEWIAFMGNPAPFTPFKVSVLVFGAILVMYAPEIRSVDWKTLDTEWQKDLRERGELPQQE
jgi:hypothetical protein